MTFSQHFFTFPILDIHWNVDVFSTICCSQKFLPEFTDFMLNSPTVHGISELPDLADTWNGMLIPSDSPSSPFPISFYLYKMKLSLKRWEVKLSLTVRYLAYKSSEYHEMKGWKHLLYAGKIYLTVEKRALELRGIRELREIIGMLMIAAVLREPSRTLL